MTATDLIDTGTPVLVTGATGSTGGAVVRALVQRGVPVRAMVRRPEAARALSSPGTETVLGDFDDAAAVAAALRGVRSAFLVTPSSEAAECQQLGFVEAAAAAGVEHLVVLSQLGARTGSPVRFLRYHAVVEDRVRELGLGHTFPRPNLFFQGLLAFAGSISAQGSMAAPIGDAGVSAVDVRDIGAVGATVLADGSHLGEALTITGPEPLSHAEMAERLGGALGRPVRFTQVPGEDFVAALDGVLPPWQLEGPVEDYAHYLLRPRSAERLRRDLHRGPAADGVLRSCRLPAGLGGMVVARAVHRRADRGASLPLGRAGSRAPTVTGARVDRLSTTG